MSVTEAFNTRFLHRSCASCGKVFERTRFNKRSCGSACRSNLNRSGLSETFTLRERIERFATVATDEDWDEIRTLTAGATDVDWLIIANGLRSVAGNVR